MNLRLQDNNNTTSIPKIEKIKNLPSKQIGYAAIALAVVGAISFGAISLYKKTLPEQLPANTQCVKALKAAADTQKTYAEQMSNALQAKPIAVVDLSPVFNAAKECNDTKNIVTLEAK